MDRYADYYLRKSAERLGQTISLKYELGIDDEFEDSVVERIKRNLAYEVFAKAELCDGIAISKPKIIKQDVKYSQSDVHKEIMGEVWYRSFVYCKDCMWFKKNGVNGGYCLRVDGWQIAHIMDGCTFGERREDDKG